MEKQLKTDFKNILENSNFSKKEIEIKEKHLNKFIQNGLPNRKLESWKFSDISQVIQKNIGDLSFYIDYSSKNEINKGLYIDELEHNKIVFINGKIENINFEQEEKNKIDILDNLDLSEDLNSTNSLINLNNALTNKHFKILVKKNYSLKKH